MSRGEPGAAAIPRILELLRRYYVRMTFFVVGHTALAYPDAVKAIVADGDEVGHHGWVHEDPYLLEREREEWIFDQGLAALDAAAGVTPVGYRAPGALHSHSTVDILLQHGMLYDASCSASEFEPYYFRQGDRFPADGMYEFGDPVDLVAIPFAWTLRTSPTSTTCRACRHPRTCPRTWRRCGVASSTPPTRASPAGCSTSRSTRSRSGGLPADAARPVAHPHRGPRRDRVRAGRRRRAPVPRAEPAGRVGGAQARPGAGESRLAGAVPGPLTRGAPARAVKRPGTRVSWRMANWRVIAHVHSSLWFVPVVCVLAGWRSRSARSPSIGRSDYELVPPAATGGPDAALAILSTVADLDGDAHRAGADHHHGRRPAGDGAVLAADRADDPARQAQPDRHRPVRRHLRARHAGMREVRFGTAGTCPASRSWSPTCWWSRASWCWCSTCTTSADRCGCRS